MTERRTILMLAATHRQVHLERNKRRAAGCTDQFVFVQSPEMIAGIEGPQRNPKSLYSVECLHGWRDHARSGDLVQALRAMGFDVTEGQG
jgi:hypothetical protein